MGLYPIKCTQCQTEFNWFSGNPDQRCQNCKEDNAQFEEAVILPTEDSSTSNEPKETESIVKLTSLELRKIKREKYLEAFKARKASKVLNRRKFQLKKAANKFKRKRKAASTSHTPMKDLKNFNADVELNRHNERTFNAGAPIKIVPDIERLLFPYYIAGASLRSICQQFGDKYDFGLQAMYTARDFYKWEQRRKAIRGVVMNDASLQVAERMKDYASFFDDLLSEAMIRFQNNSKSGQNTNPFNTLKITNIRDIKDLTELMINVTNGGVKKVEIDNKNGLKLSDKKASQLLEILAEEDEKE